MPSVDEMKPQRHPFQFTQRKLILAVPLIFVDFVI
jgi:hypothetical protein